MKRDRDPPGYYDSNTIISIVEDIYKTNKSVAEKKTEYNRKYPDFAEQFPVLFESCCEPDFDVARFKSMIRLRDDIQTNKTTFEQASKKVGQSLYDEYVKPHVSE